MPNLSDPLKTDDKLIFLAETRISPVLEGERRCFGLYLHTGNPGALFINACGTWRGAELGGLVQGMIPDAPKSPGLDPG